MQLEGKNGIIFGLTSNPSFLYKISEKLKENGANLGFACHDGNLDSLKKATEQFNPSFVLNYNYEENYSMFTFFEEVKRRWVSVDFIIYAISAFKNEDFDYDFLNMDRDHFLKVFEINIYSMVRMLYYAKEFFQLGGSILTFSYYGFKPDPLNTSLIGITKKVTEEIVKSTAIEMAALGVRVNCISTGAYMTSSSEKSDLFNQIVAWNKEQSILRKVVSDESMAEASLYLLSKAATHITGHILNVDSGFHILDFKKNSFDDIISKK